MHTILEIPMDAYLLCLSRFKARPPEYLTVRNGITLDNDRGEKVVRIRCDSGRVTSFLSMVSDICPEFTDKIRQLPDTGD